MDHYKIIHYHPIEEYYTLSDKFKVIRRNRIINFLLKMLLKYNYIEYEKRKLVHFETITLSDSFLKFLEGRIHDYYHYTLRGPNRIILGRKEQLEYLGEVRDYSMLIDLHYSEVDIYFRGLKLELNPLIDGVVVTEV